MDFMFNLLLFVSSIVTGMTCAWLAKKRGYDPSPWFLVGAFLGVIGVCLVFLAPIKKKKRQRNARTTRRAPVQRTAVKELRVPSSMAEKFWYYLDTEHQQNGPVSFDALKRNWKEGKITFKTLVWNEEIDNWKPLNELVTTNVVTTSSPLSPQE